MVVGYELYVLYVDWCVCVGWVVLFVEFIGDDLCLFGVVWQFDYWDIGVQQCLVFGCVYFVCGGQVYLQLYYFEWIVLFCECF